MPTDWRRMWGKMQSNKSNQRKSKCFLFFILFHQIESKTLYFFFRKFIIYEYKIKYEIIKTTLPSLNISYCAYSICIFLFFFLVWTKVDLKYLNQTIFKASWGFLQMKLIGIVIINFWGQLWLKTNLSYKL